jgi:hypothetical protein
MLGGAREFRYDWILLRARNLPHEAGGNTGPIILRGGKRLAVRPARLSAARSSECRNDRRFPPPWSVEERQTCFIVKDGNGQALAYVYFEEEPGRRAAENLMSHDEAGALAVNIAKLPELLCKKVD